MTSDARPPMYVYDLSTGKEVRSPEAQAEGYRQALLFTCGPHEIARCLKPRNGHDHLLKLRADTILDHVRLARGIATHRRSHPHNWTLTNFFDKKPFRAFIRAMRHADSVLCRHLPAGFTFSTEPDGACIKTDFGNIIIVSSALERFLYFMNLAHLDTGTEVPADVRLRATVIAIRAMLMSESHDFEIDPRGIIPPELDGELRRFTSYQLHFIIGHEYAHHLLGHLRASRTTKIRICAVRRGISGETTSVEVHNQEQKQEFEADAASVAFHNGLVPAPRANICHAALAWFAYLDLYQHVSERLYPTPPWTYRSHPKPLERLWRLYSTYDRSLALQRTEVEQMVESIGRDKAWLNERITLDPDLFEVYGSFYLAEPNTKWRGPQLRDRVDY